jgi:transcriptional regulator GlxA family with amidase domain
VDTLIVPGALEMDAAVCDRRLVRWIRKTALTARRVVSVCSGAFLLAEAGLLDGRRAVTHWAQCGRLKKRYPAVNVDPGPIFVRDGRVYTSAGVTAGLDLALALVEEDLGREASLELARWFVMFLVRPGDQSQFSVHLEAQRAGPAPLRELLRWIADNPTGDLSVSALAGRMNMSPRHFARVFVRETGLTPARYVHQARLERARRDLEGAPHGLKRVAARAGFGAEESLRRAFQRELRITPGEYRARFQRTDGARRAPRGPAGHHG